MAGYGLKFVARAEVVCDDAGDFGAVAFADPTERAEKIDDDLLAGETIIDMLPVTPPLDEGRAAKKLQMPGGIREGQAGPVGKVLDAALALAEMLEQFKAMRMPERPSDLGETGKDVLFRAPA